MDTHLSARELEFLLQSNAIEDIENIDYSDPANAQPDRGHVGAFLEAREAARDRRIITLADICRWQSWITEEQQRFHHDIPKAGVGRFRGPDAPFNVRVGTHFPPEFSRVFELMQTWIGDLTRRLTEPTAGTPALIAAADLVGELFQRFEAIHPFVDGNGRVGRLIANYLALFLGRMLIVFRSDERPAFYAAHRSKPAMKLFIANKLREAMIHPLTGKLLRRIGGDLATDIYATDSGEESIMERHDVVPALEHWAQLAAAKDRDRLRS